MNMQGPTAQPGRRVRAGPSSREASRSCAFVHMYVCVYIYIYIYIYTYTRIQCIPFSTSRLSPETISGMRRCLESPFPEWARAYMYLLYDVVVLLFSFHNILHYTILYDIVVYYNILYYTLHYTILYYNTMTWSQECRMDACLTQCGVVLDRHNEALYMCLCLHRNYCTHMYIIDRAS